MLPKLAAVALSSFTAPLTETVMPHAEREFLTAVAVSVVSERKIISHGDHIRPDHHQTDRVVDSDFEEVDMRSVSQQTNGSRDIVISPVFKLIFLTVVTLTVVSGIVATAIAFASNGYHPNQQAMFDSMNTAWKLGLGAILGLLGGKTT